MVPRRTARSSSPHSSFGELLAAAIVDGRVKLALRALRAQHDDDHLTFVVLAEVAIAS
jgi:hypothetical protein